MLREEDTPVEQGPEDFVLEAPAELATVVLQVPEMSPWQLGPSFGWSLAPCGRGSLLEPLVTKDSVWDANQEPFS